MKKEMLVMGLIAIMVIMFTFMVNGSQVIQCEQGDVHYLDEEGMGFCSYKEEPFFEVENKVCTEG